MLWRRMKVDVTHVDPRSYGHAERLNGAIQVLVIKRVFIVPNPGSRISHFVTHEPDTISAWSGLDLVYRRASPSFNGWLFSHCVASATKTKGLVDSGYSVLTVGSVVIHVALVRMTLAPGAFVRDNVFRFGEIGCPLV
jgi:hypothetical protein